MGKLKNSLKPFLKKTLYSSIPKSSLVRYYARNRKSNSQAGQDFWVFGEVFNEKRGGYFVELGSNDGILLNNTLLLEKRYDWSGICLEANPIVFKTLSEVRKVKCLNVCIGEDNGSVSFLNDGLFSRILFDEPEQAEFKDDPRSIKLSTNSLTTIFEQNKVPREIDYFSIDIEGAEWLALKDFAFDKYLFNSITIERPNEDLRELLEKEGYIIIKEIPDLDTFYIHNTFLERYLKNSRNYWTKMHKAF